MRDKVEHFDGDRYTALKRYPRIVVSAKIVLLIIMLVLAGLLVYLLVSGKGVDKVVAAPVVGSPVPALVKGGCRCQRK